MEIKEMIAVLKAFEERKEIEVRSNNSHPWGCCVNPRWDFGTNIYRIKPQPIYIPFTWEDRDLFRGKWIRLKGGQNEHMINFVDSSGMVSCSTWEESGTLKSLFESHEFIDGTVFGKLS